MRAMSRDNARTPMQWDASPQAGFTTGTPWLPVNPDHTLVNAAAQVGDPESVFAHYQSLIRLRRQFTVVVDGRFELLLPEHPSIVAFTRRLDDQALLVVANLSSEPADLHLPDAVTTEFADGPVLLGSGMPPAGPGRPAKRSRLAPWEAWVISRGMPR